MAAARSALAIALLAAPTVLAFFSGGYFERARLIAAIGACVALALAAIVAPQALPATRPARLCLAGLAGLAAWTGLSILWAPVRDAALGDAERMVLYAAFATAAAAALSDPAARRRALPLLLAGAVVVLGYGVATRVVPELVPSTPGTRAGNRLDQPLTYWNAVGALASIALVLAIGLAGDERRRRTLRSAAAASAPVLALALYLTLSRGAVVAFAAGVAALLLLGRPRAVVAATSVVAAAAGGITVAVAAKLPAVETLGGTSGAHDRQRLLMLAVIAAAMAAAAAAQSFLARSGPPPPRRAAIAAGAVAAILLAGIALPHASDPPSQAKRAAVPARDANGLPSTPARLRTLETNRPRYWEAAVAVFADHPLRGAGTHGFAAEWLERRTIPETVKDAHSLYLETPAELGLVGLALLACFLAGLAACANRVARRSRAEVAAPAAAALTYLVHAGFDWDWEMPALTGVFLLLAAWLAATAGEAAA